jgi:hypothetical protein
VAVILRAVIRRRMTLYALAIGYLAQLLLNTVPGVQKEYQAIRAAEAKQALRKSLAGSHARLPTTPLQSPPLW